MSYSLTHSYSSRRDTQEITVKHNTMGADNWEDKVEFKRSMVGTVIFALLATLHISSAFRIFNVIFYEPYIDWWELAAELFQLGALALYVTMIFVPLRTNTLRLAVGGFFCVALFINLMAFFIVWSYADLIDLIFLGLVAFDSVAIAAMFTKPWTTLNKFTPFVAEKIDPRDEDIEEAASMA